MPRSALMKDSVSRDEGDKEIVYMKRVGVMAP